MVKRAKNPNLLVEFKEKIPLENSWSSKTWYYAEDLVDDEDYNSYDYEDCFKEELERMSVNSLHWAGASDFKNDFKQALTSIFKNLDTIMDLKLLYNQANADEDDTRYRKEAFGSIAEMHNFLKNTNMNNRYICLKIILDVVSEYKPKLSVKAKNISYASLLKEVYEKLVASRKMDDYADILVSYPLSLYLPLFKLFKEYGFTNCNCVLSSELSRAKLFQDINKEAKSLGVAVLFTEDFHSFMDNLIFYVSGENYRKILLDLPIFEVSSRIPGFKNNKYLENNLVDFSYSDMYSFWRFIKALLKTGLVKDEDAKYFFTSYLLNNRNILDTHDSLGMSAMVEVFDFIVEPEIFWLFYFHFLHAYPTDIVKSTGSQDVILKGFFNTSILKNENLNWRIPSEYVVCLNGTNNIVSGMLDYHRTHSISGSILPFGVANILKQNDLVLLNYKGFDKGRLNKILSESSISDDFLWVEPKKWWHFFKNKSNSVEVYEYLGSTSIRFNSNNLYNPPLAKNKSSNEDSIDAKSAIDIINSWTKKEINLNEEVRSVLIQLSEKVFNGREFLKTFKFYSEEVDFITERVDHYVLDVLSTYKNEMKKQEAISRISTVKSSTDLNKELVNSLKVIDAQIQVNLDKIALEVQDGVDFEAKKMSIFMETRFPDAVNKASS